MVLAVLGGVEVVEVKFVEFALAPESNQGLDDSKLGIYMPRSLKRLWMDPPQSLYCGGCLLAEAGAVLSHPTPCYPQPRWELIEAIIQATRSARPKQEGNCFLPVMTNIR